MTKRGEIFSEDLVFGSSEVRRVIPVLKKTFLQDYIKRNPHDIDESDVEVAIVQRIPETKCRTIDGEHTRGKSLTSVPGYSLSCPK